MVLKFNQEDLFKVEEDLVHNKTWKPTTGVYLPNGWHRCILNWIRSLELANELMGDISRYIHTPMCTQIMKGRGESKKRISKFALILQIWEGWEI